MTTRPITIGEIIAKVVERRKVTFEDMISTSRYTPVVRARGELVVAARELTGMSFPEIGRAMKRKTHTSAFTAYNRAMNSPVEMREVAAIVESIHADRGRMDSPPKPERVPGKAVRISEYFRLCHEMSLRPHEFEKGRRERAEWAEANSVARRGPESAPLNDSSILGVTAILKKNATAGIVVAQDAS